MPQPTIDRPVISRTFALDGIEIVSRAKGGDGRTVEAYATPFDAPNEIHDEYGDYNEKIARTAFDRVLGDPVQVARVQVLYNHALDAYGNSQALLSVPLGKALDIKADGSGLMTITRYNKSELADAVLASIKNGDITSQSFRGPAYESVPARVPRVRAGAPLPTVTRTRLGLRDYGPTPAPSHPGAKITVVRSLQEITDDLLGMSEEERAELIRALSAAPLDPTDSSTGSDPDPGTDDSCDIARSVRLLRLRARTLLEGVG